MNLMESLELLRKNELVNIKLVCYNREGDIIFNPNLYYRDSDIIIDYLKSTFEHILPLHIHLRTMYIDGTEIERDDYYTYKIRYAEYKSNVGIGSDVKICTGSENQWAKGTITKSTFIKGVYLNTNFGIIKINHYRVIAGGATFHHFPYSGRTSKRPTEFSDTIGLPPKINYDKIITRFGPLPKGIKIKIHRMAPSLSLEHQKIKKENKSCKLSENKNDFCTFDGQLLNIYIANH
jgi:hypothetical protein